MKEKVERVEKEKKYLELTFESSDDFNKYTGKIKTSELGEEDYILTIYKKGSVVRKLRRLGINENEIKNIKYREIII